MGLDERSVEIANAFLKFIETGEKSLIEGFTREEIESALFEFHKDKLQGLPYYHAMRGRLVELGDLERSQREEERWKDRVIGFVSGLILALIIIFLMKYLFSA
jgi:hypothetical protein